QYLYSVVAFDSYPVATASAESPAKVGIAQPGFWKSGRADAFATGASQGADGIRTSLGLEWAYAAGGTVYCAPAINSVGGTLYFTSAAGFFHAVAPSGVEVARTPLLGAAG